MSRVLLLGLDVGGSKTLLRGEWRDGPACLERRGPGANPNRTGDDRAAAILARLAGAALSAALGAERLVLAAGVAGAGTAKRQNALANALRRRLQRPSLAVQVEVVHDGLIALDAAYDRDSGVILIAGTGSLVLARPRDGPIVRSGGWGPLLGDDGSGHALGRSGLRAVAEALDGGRDTVLRSRVLETLGLDDRADLLAAVYDDACAVSNVAPLVIEAAQDGDTVASGILRTQVAALARQCSWIRQQPIDLAPRLTILGGLVSNDHYRSVLERALTDHVPDWTVRRLDTEPVTGALRRARRLAAPA